MIDLAQNIEDKKIRLFLANGKTALHWLILSCFLFTLPCITQSQAVAEKVNSEQLEELNDLAFTLRYRRSDTVFVLTQQAVNFAHSRGDTMALVTALNILGDAFQHRSQLDSASFYLQQSAQLAAAIGFQEGVGYNLTAKGLFHKRKKEYEKALDSFEQSLAIRQQLPDTTATIYTLRQIAVIQRVTGDYRGEYETLSDLLDLCLLFEDPLHLGRTYKAIAINYNRGGDYLNALENFQISSNWYQKNEQPGGIASSYHELGILYNRLQDGENAKRNLWKAARIYEEIDRPKDRAWVISDLGEAYKIEGDIDSALLLLWDGARDLQRFKWNCPSRYPLSDIGQIYLDRNQLDSAEIYFSKALELSEPCRTYIIMPSILNGLGRVYIKQGRLQQAKSILEKALDISNEYNFQVGIRDSKEALYELYDRQSNYPLALEYLKEYKAISDSLINQELIRKLAYLEKENQFSQEKQKLETENKMKAQELSRQRFIQRVTLLGLLIALLFLSVIGRFYWLRQKANDQLKNLNQEISAQKDHIQQLDALKTRFFANISHEFRTPLTIISGMMDQIEKNPSRWLKKGARMIRNNNANLLDLINQILDLQKLEANSLQPVLQQNNIIDFLKTIAEQFQALAQSKDQVLKFEPGADSLYMDYDSEKTLRIVSNLLSNAIKYNSEKGEVTFEVKTGVNDGEITDKNLVIQVSDTGYGIPEEDLPFVFDRFYQASTKGKITDSGTGIGLALTRELVQLLGGEIEVQSQLGQGTSFRVLLPITQHAPVAETTDAVQISAAIFGKKVATAKAPASNSDLPVALIVEDNADISQYLEICLEGHYQLIVATDGQKGIERAYAHIPDIIISDVMMPKKDGFELCEALKGDIRTSHIPIILLTAKSDVESRIQGLKYGADDYLSKPFHEEELLVRMQNLLEVRKKLQERYQDIYAQPLPKVKVSAPDLEDAFILQIKAIIEERMADPQFNLDQLSEVLNLSRSQLGRKVKALTGRSLSLFVRAIRLQKARQLLQDATLSIKEVAYDVGFSDPAYFSRAYAEEYGESPSETRPL